MEYSFGTGPGTPASPLLSPSSDQALQGQPLDVSDHEPFEDAALDIEELFRRRLAALRRLRSWERPHALRAARDKRTRALKAVRDRRAWKRHARRLLRRQNRPTPH